jgi:uncharacterized protein YuzE
MIRFDYPNVAIEYDSEARAAYIYLKEGIGPEGTMVLAHGLHVDVDGDGEAVGVEVLF